MEASNLHHIIAQVDQLDYEDQLELISTLVSNLKRQKKAEHTLLELSGLGKEIWQNQNTVQYIHQMRDEWQ